MEILGVEPECKKESHLSQEENTFQCPFLLDSGGSSKSSCLLSTQVFQREGSLHTKATACLNIQSKQTFLTIKQTYNELPILSTKSFINKYKWSTKDHLTSEGNQYHKEQRPR